jgi:alpha-L-fucosidase
MKFKSRREFLGTVPAVAWAAGAGVMMSSLLGGGCSKDHPMDATSTVRDEASTQWYRDAKFGLFIHWGPYSVAGVEASWPIMKPEWFPYSPPISEKDYLELPKRFNPTQYDPHAWVQLAKQAGIRYVVFTTKHHDGFCMFDAPGTDYKITNTPYGKDVLALLAAACEEEKMPLGLYYSPPDMHHLGFRDMSKPAVKNWHGEPSRAGWAAYLDYMESHLRTLLTRYGPVAIIWFDGLFGVSKYNPPRFHKLIRELSPSTLINDRLGPGGDYVTPEQFFPDGIPIRPKEPASDISPRTVELWTALAKILPQEWVTALLVSMAKKRYPTAPHPSPQEFQLWETCMTMNGTWSYNPSDKNFKSAEELIRTLVEVASRGGNFLLNVGPSPEGTFPPMSEERLQRIGKWMHVNGESIYGTTYGQLQSLPFGRMTSKGRVIYLHLFSRPTKPVEISGFPGRVASVSQLAGGRELQFEQSDDRLRIAAPTLAPDAVVPVLALQTVT